ncbi:MAG: NAD-dependent DNA ligase LigA [Halobacteriovoraceae bacterium]|nr:NAD-dependent DNA ligase LigA [Halobacteriovoraceae bacterium]
MDQQKIERLEREILKHKELYYRGKPEISDYDYDKLEEELTKLSPNSPVLSVVGAKVSSDQKIKHDKKMLSLDKVYELEELEKWADSREVVSTFKIDGSSCSLVYEEGVLKLAKTRGDGVYGENILEKAVYIPDIPKSVNQEISFEIRGEVFCTEENFSRICEQMLELKLEIPQSQRNIVAGILGRKENIFLAQYLNFMAFEFFSDDVNLETEMQKFQLLEKLKFSVLEYHKSSKKNELQKRVKEAQDFMEDGEYLIDGLVFSFNDLELHKTLGETGHHPRYKLAFKFRGETKTSTIKDIEWNVSRNGVITPVAIIEPVEISQAVVSRVTLHNYGLVHTQNLKVGDEIEIIRSGEVIPKFLRVTKESKGKFSYPHKCPSCDSELKREDIRIICNNSKCPAKIIEEIRYFVSKMNIEDISIKRLAEMLKHQIITDIPSLYDVTAKKLLALDKVKDKLANKMVNNIQGSKDVELVTFLTALGISGGGAQKCEKIINAGYTKIEDFLSLTVEQLTAIDGFAEKSSVEFISSLKKKKKLIEKLLKKGIKIKAAQLNNKKKTLSGKKFCITGTLTRKRSDIQKDIKAQGGEVVSSVTGNTDFLVTNDTESSSSKFKKAKELEKPIITENQLYKMMD